MAPLFLVLVLVNIMTSWHEYLILLAVIAVATLHFSCMVAFMVHNRALVNVQALEKEGEDMLQRYDEECLKWQRMAETKGGCSATALSIYEANNRAKLEMLNPRWVCVRALNFLMLQCRPWQL
jgi:hypothetical protein